MRIQVTPELPDRLIEEEAPRGSTRSQSGPRFCHAEDAMGDTSATMPEGATTSPYLRAGRLGCRAGAVGWRSFRYLPTPPSRAFERPAAAHSLARR